MNKTGKVWLVGAGPSDPGLFTLKGKKVLTEAQVVVYDKLVGNGVLAMMPENAQLIDVGKTAGKHPVPQDEINRILLDKALEGKRVVRLKGGDPFVFGRGGEELELLVENNIPYEIVPGITSAVSVPMYNGIPVTHRDYASSFHVITGHRKKGREETDMPDFKKLAKLEGTLVFLMGISNMERITKGLIEGGMPEEMPAAVLERGTTAHQRRVVSTLKDLYKDSNEAGIKTPAIIVVGKVCSLADRFGWAEKRPLAGLKIGVTRPKDRISKLAEKLEEKGAETLLIPAVKTTAFENQDRLKDALDNISDYEIIAFTSPFGVKTFFSEMIKMKKDIRSLGNIKFAAIGSATAAEINKRGILTDYMPEVYSGEKLGELLSEAVSENGKILLPRAAKGTDDVLVPLIKKHIMYSDVPVYDTEPETAITPVHYTEDTDLVAFTSASTVNSFADANRDLDFTKIKAVCIGEKTAEAAGVYQMETYVSERASLDSMVKCIVENFGKDTVK